MSRKEFFQHVGVFILGIIGVSGLIAHFSKSLNLPKPTSSSARGGYGSQPYGR